MINRQRIGRLKAAWVGMLCLGSCSAFAQTGAVQNAGNGVAGVVVAEQAEVGGDRAKLAERLIRQARGAELSQLMQTLFGQGADDALRALEQDDGALFAQLDAVLQRQLDEQREQTESVRLAPPSVLSSLSARTPAFLPRLQAPVHAKLARSLNAPNIEVQNDAQEFKAKGSDTKSFETKEAKGTRTEQAETRYVNDGVTFGMEIKSTQVIQAVSKLDGKAFRQEISIRWGADVAACPDVNGITAGTGRANVLSKTTYTENGLTVTMASAFDLQAKLKGFVDDKAEMTHYDVGLDAYLENSGYEEALRRTLVKDIKINDGRYGLHYDIAGNTLEVSDGTYGGKRTPAKLGKVTATLLTSMTDAQTNTVGSAFGPMVPSIWNAANEVYKSARSNWRHYKCVDVVGTAAKTILEPGEEVTVSARTVSSQDGGDVNADMTASAYPGRVLPESRRASPTATFTFTQEGEENSTVDFESVSKRGIGRGEVEFQVRRTEATASGGWTGVIEVRRTRREEREKRSGANLQENGGYLDLATNVSLRLTGQLDRSVDATNAHIAVVSGEETSVDYEYDRYEVDEGYCGPNAVPYKGPKELTRTSTTTVRYGKETRVFVEIGQSSGSLTFSLPEQQGSTLHRYVHTSPCAEHDRANTSQVTSEDVPGVGGSFSVTFPVDSSQQTIEGSTTVQEEDGGTTTYRWALTRRP